MPGASAARTAMRVVLAGKMAANVSGLAELESLLRMVRPDFVKIDARQVTQPDAMQRAVTLSRDSGARPIFTRIESIGQRDYLQQLPDVLLQGRALAWPSVLPATWLPHEFAA